MAGGSVKVAVTIVGVSSIESEGSPGPLERTATAKCASSTTHSATCAARNAVDQMCRRLAVLERPPSFSTVMTSLFEARMDGTNPKTSTVSIDTPINAARTRQSTE